MKKYDADVALATNVRVGNGKKTKKRLELTEEKVYTELQDKIDVCKQKSNECPTNKIYRRSFLEENNIMFDDKFNEDGSFNLRCGWISNNKYAIDQPLCYWMDNRESITRKNENFMVDIAEDYIVTYTNREPR